MPKKGGGDDTCMPLNITEYQFTDGWYDDYPIKEIWNTLTFQRPAANNHLISKVHLEQSAGQ